MTLYSLARKYSITLDALLSANPYLDPRGVPIGFPVTIPIPLQSIRFSPPPSGDEGIWLSYRVLPKETLYRISKVYLGTVPDSIAKLNPGIASGLTIGQVIHLGWLHKSVPNETVVYSQAMIDSVSVLPKDFIKESSEKGLVIKQQKGLAVWKSGSFTSHFYVLHPTAKVGTYMEITNLMLHRTITAKVAGNFPPGLYQSHVGIVVSPSTARALGVLDQQFFAKWRYVE
jgi:hypothetical protein